jgi:ABC-type branched-subunit amino acid transport system permease subunit
MSTDRPESSQRTQRVLGLAGIAALALIGTLAILGIIVVILRPTADRTSPDALTALSTVAAATVGAVSGWLARGHVQDPPRKEDS